MSPSHEGKEDEEEEETEEEEAEEEDYNDEGGMIRDFPELRVEITAQRYLI